MVKLGSNVAQLAYYSCLWTPMKGKGLNVDQPL
jgi:hypothetical protein